MARQYFNSTSADSLIVASSVTPTTTQTSIFTPYTLCQQAFPIGYGLSAPFAGQIYRFACGGIITTASGAQTIIITPFYGAGSSTTSWTNAVNMGVSATTNVSATAVTNAPWLMQGYLVFRAISSAATSSTAWLTGVFETVGTIATAATAVVIPFGSTAAISVDTNGTAANGLQSYGSLTFSYQNSLTGSTIVTEWTSMQSLN